VAWSNKIESVISSGIPLNHLGINNWALNKEQAVRALDELEKAGVPVLGGDVYEIVDDIPESNNDNWYCNRHENEPLEQYVSRSIEHTRKYVDSYCNPSRRETLFVLVAE